MRRERVAAIILRQFYLIRGSMSRVLPLFVWVVIDVVLWGFITRYLGTVSMPGVNFVASLLGAVLLWDFLTRVMQGVTMAFFEDVWSRNFLNLFSTPIRISEYLTGLVLSSIATSTIGLATMALVASLVFHLTFATYGWMLVPYLGVLFLFGIALGVFGATIVLRLGPAAEWFVWPIPAVAAPFAGVFYPVATLPRWMQGISYALPPSHVFEGLRAIVAGRAPSPVGLAWGAVLAAGYLLLACWGFARVYRYGVRTGLIARYSAESVT
ncbi:MAG TPA: ABC transporter permease [Gemmatimonadaceae bacterium]|nr:ABC transporter permease [Gemmatimonadaceae bacterium]